MKRNTLIMLFGVLVGCASMPETEITGSNNYIQMPHFSFVVPSNQGWRLLKRVEGLEVVFLVKRFGYRTCQMEMGRISVSDPKRTWSAKRLADDVRDVWKNDVIKKGTLLDVAMGEETVADKNYYTMTYAASADGG